MKLSPKWRVAAITALLVYLLLLIVIVGLVAHNLGFALLFGFTVVVLCCALWLLLTGSRQLSIMGGVLSAAGLVGLIVELYYFLSDKGNRRAVLVALVLSFIYLGLINVLRRKYWHDVRLIGQTNGKTADFHKPYLIINPKSGNGRAIKAQIDKKAKKQGISVVFTEKGVDVEAVARRVVKAGADVLGISGGDGSIGAVAKVAIEQQIPIVVLPGGTKCHFARDLGLDPNRIADALAGFKGVERRIDVADINGRIFLNNVSFGLYADMVDKPEYREHKMKISRSVLQKLVSGERDLYDLQFQYDGMHINKAAQVLIGVNSYETLKVFELGHRKRLDGGVLQITAITQLNNRIVRELLEAMSLNKLEKHESAQIMYQWVSKAFTITNSVGVIVAGVDGEREKYDTPVTLLIKPKSLRVFVPAEGVRNRPKNRFSVFVARQIWRSALPR